MTIQDMLRQTQEASVAQTGIVSIGTTFPINITISPVDPARARVSLGANLATSGNPYGSTTNLTGTLINQTTLQISGARRGSGDFNLAWQVIGGGLL